MAYTLSRSIVRAVALRAKEKAARRALPSRLVDPERPEAGRFTPSDIKALLAGTRSIAAALDASVPEGGSLGNWQNAYLGCLDLALYRGLRELGIGAAYARSLVADLMWQVVVGGGGIIPIVDPVKRLFRRLFCRDKVELLGRRLRDSLRYPYSPPGYRIDFALVDGVYHMDVHCCPVNDFFRQFGEEELSLFRGSWCTFDFSATRQIVEGGRHVREHCLADGDDLCDMRWWVER